MRLPFALFTIRNGVTACLMISSLSLMAVDAIGPAHAFVLAGAILYGRLARRPLLRPRAWDLLALAALLLFPFDLFLLSRNLIGSALRLLTFVVIYRCSNLRSHRDMRQAVALSFVQMLAAAASTTEAYFSIFLVAYLLLVIWALMAMASARDEAPAAARKAPGARPALAMAASTVATGAIVFFVIPHFGTGYFHPTAMAPLSKGGLTGFTQGIELGSISRIKKNRAVVMRAHIDPSARRPGEPLLWRGVALDTFDGRSWSLSQNDWSIVGRQTDGSFRVDPDAAPGPGLVSQEITMLPLLSPVLFALPGVARIESDELSFVGVDTSGAVHLTMPPLKRFTYRAWSAPASARTTGEASEPDGAARYLTLPRVDPRLADLARRILSAQKTGDAPRPLDKARAIESYLRSHYAYTLDVDDAGVADPLSHFLLEGHPGHCEYFATSMAVLLRYLEVPSRVVNGFSSGEWSRFSRAWVVRQSDAHSWVEAWIPGSGWMTFDPTPAAADAGSPVGLVAGLRDRIERLELMWDTWIIGLDLLDQRSAVAVVVDGLRAAGDRLERTAAAAARTARGLAGLGWREGLAALAAAVIAVLFGRAAWRRLGAFDRRSGRRRATDAMLRRIEARWAARGVRRSAWQTPMEVARQVEALHPAEADAVSRDVRDYYHARYGR